MKQVTSRGPVIVMVRILLQSLFLFASMAGSAWGAYCSADMISYWKLDETAGNVFTDACRGPDGSCTGNCPASTTGKIKAGRQFVAETGIAVPGSAFDWRASDSFSIEYWMKKEVAPLLGEEVIAGRAEPMGTNWWTGLWESGEAAFVLGAANGDGSDPSRFLHGAKNLADGKWHHIVALRDGLAQENRLYVDGNLEDAKQVSYAAGFNAAPETTLNLGWSAGHYYAGTLDEVAIYNRVLTEREIRSHYYLVREYHSVCAVPVKIMPLGNSITTGFSSGVDDPAFQISYRKDLWDSLIGAEHYIDFVGSQITGWAYQETEGFDPDNEGHPGWRADRLADRAYDWLSAYRPDLVLLHAGTVAVEPSPNAIERLLDEIDRYDEDLTVLLARIINRVPYSQTTTEFNNNVEAMAMARIAAGDKIIYVDLEDGAGLIYQRYPAGDIWDDVHPYATGYKKMAAVWLAALTDFMPVCYPPLNLGNDLLALYHFDKTANESEQLVADFSGNGQVATCDQAAGECPAWTADGRFAGAFAYDGLDDRFTVADAPQWDLADFTIATWVKISAYTGQDMHIWGHRGAAGSSRALWLYLNSSRDNRLTFARNDVNLLESKSRLPTGVWQHIAVTYAAASGEILLYLNGLLVDSNTQPAALYLADNPIDFGLRTAKNDSPFYGLIDETVLWGKTLTPEHVLELYYLASGMGVTCVEAETASCYNGPAGTEGTGVCRAGVQTCTLGQWSACLGEVLPQSEVCGDGLDNDCNNEVDEGALCCSPGATRPCGSALGACELGLETCDSSGQWDGICAGEVLPAPELCDELDNNCNGEIDESCGCLDGQTQACGSELGLCAAGQQTCAGGAWGECLGSIAPVPEICGDGLDQDCDGADQSCSTLSAGLLALYHFDNTASETGQLVLDFSGNDNHAACDQAAGDCPAWIAAGRFAGAFLYDGLDDNFTVPDSPLWDLADFTLSTWIKISAYNGQDMQIWGHRGAISSSRALRLYINFSSGNRLTFARNDVDLLASDAALPTGVWHHLVVSYEAATGDIRLYLNGQLTDSGNQTAALYLTDNAIDFGLRTAKNDNPFLGAIDETALWNKALTAEQVVELSTLTAGLGISETCAEGETVSCYTGPLGTAGAGVCRAGLQTCTAGLWSGCEGEILPRSEICADGLDNDCNNEVDEGALCCAPGETRLCGSEVGACEYGLESCDAAGQWDGSCAGEVQPAQELCDALDNDCDGEIDETCDCVAGASQPCGVDLGLCQSGTQVCDRGSWGECLGGIAPAPEICGDGVDQDCNGADQSCSLLTTGLVALYHFDQLANENSQLVLDFAGNGQNASCDQAAGGCPLWTPDGKFGGAFLYDGLDDNFTVADSPLWDLADFSFSVWIKLSGYTGQDMHIWGHRGPTSATRALWLYINAANGNRLSFRRNDLDLLQSPSPLPTGAWYHLAVTYEAASGDIRLYVNGLLVDSGNQQAALYATANPVDFGLRTAKNDNPFLGAIDEMGLWNKALTAEQVGELTRLTAGLGDAQCAEGETASCYTGPLGTEGAGVCRAGTRICAAGQWSACEGEILPRAEVCGDGLDNDCNNEVDEGALCCTPGETRPCGSDLGACESGLETCDAAGQWEGSCAGEVTPVPELCDALDNNCDGQIDETCGCVDGASQPCGLDLGLCQPGTQVCDRGSWGECLGGVAPASEICGDGIDQDCNGADQPCGTLTTGLLALYHFDHTATESGQLVLDFSGNGNHATCDQAAGGCPLWSADGKFDGAFSYDGLDDNFTVADSPLWDLADFSLSTWIKISGYSGQDMHVWGHRGAAGPLRALWLYINSADGNRLSFRRNDVDLLQSTSSLPTGVWHHLTVTYEAATGDIRLYVNGELMDSGNQQEVLYATANPVDFGLRTAKNDNPFRGAIDETALWGKTLSAAQVLELYHLGVVIK